MQKQNIIYSSIEWLTSNECVEHIKSSLRLIHRNHVTSLVNSKEGEIIDSLNCTVASPLSVIGSLELLLLGPVKLVSPFLTTLPIADEILITRVNKNRYVLREQVSHLRSKIQEPIRSES